jgi:hypothetical protein
MFLFLQSYIENIETLNSAPLLEDRRETGRLKSDTRSTFR